MFTKKITMTVAAAVVFGVMLPGAAHATNGYFSHGYGTANKGLAGAGVALPQDSLAGATNPAGMVHVGDRIDAGVALFSPIREYTVSGGPSGFPGTFGLFPGTVESGSELFLVPHFGKNWMLTNDTSFGISVYGNGGMNTDYDANDTPMGLGTFFAGDTGTDYLQLFINASYARKMNQNFSWGVSGIVAYHRFELEGAGSFAGFSTDPANLSNRGADDSFGYGAKFGIQAQLNPDVTLGVSYQTEINMDEVEKYAGLLADAGDFDIPSTATIGIAWKVNEKGTLVFDVQRINFTDVDMLENPFSFLTMGCAAGDFSKCLGGPNGAGAGWDDQTVYKIGYQWNTSPDMTWRVGYNHGDQPIPSTEVLFNTLFPAVVENHITFGFTKKSGPKKAFTLAFMYAPETDVKGPNPLEVPGLQTVELAMKQWEIEASWTW